MRLKRRFTHEGIDGCVLKGLDPFDQARVRLLANSRVTVAGGVEVPYAADRDAFFDKSVFSYLSKYHSDWTATYVEHRIRELEGEEERMRDPAELRREMERMGGDSRTIDLMLSHASYVRQANIAILRNQSPFTYHTWLEAAFSKRGHVEGKIEYLNALARKLHYDPALLMRTPALVITDQYRTRPEDRVETLLKKTVN